LLEKTHPEFTDPAKFAVERLLTGLEPAESTAIDEPFSGSTPQRDRPGNTDSFAAAEI